MNLIWNRKGVRKKDISHPLTPFVRDAEITENWYTERRTEWTLKIEVGLMKWIKKASLFYSLPWPHLFQCKALESQPCWDIERILNTVDFSPRTLRVRVSETNGRDKKMFFWDPLRYRTNEVSPAKRVMRDRLGVRNPFQRSYKVCLPPSALCLYHWQKPKSV